LYCSGRFSNLVVKVQVYNPWLISYLSENQRLKSRYELDKYLLEAGHTPQDIELAWEALSA
jgi:hypothetical protein